MHLVHAPLLYGGGGVCMSWSQVQWRPTWVSNWIDCVSAQCETHSLLVTQTV